MRGTLLVMGLLASTALYAPAWADEPVRGGVIQVALADDPPELDPHLTASNASRTVLHNIFATLVEIDENLLVVPGIAKSWEITDEGKTITFHLNEGVKFHDDTDLDAEAVKYNFDRMRDKEFGSARAGELAFVTDVTVVDPLTVTVTLSQPYGGFMAALASWSGMMVSPTAAKEHGRDFGQVLVGAGPFKFIERIRDDRVVLDRFDNYFKEGLPYVDKVIFRPFTDVDARVMNLESGSVHIIHTVPGKAVKALQASPNVTLSSIPGLGFNGIWINTNSNDLGSAARRAAVSACIDRQIVVDTVFGDAATAAIGPFSPATWVVDTEDEAPKRDLDRARALLAEAGVPDGFSFEVLVAPDEENIRVASLYAAMCQEVGIQFNIQQSEFGATTGRMGEGNYTSAMINLSPRNDPDLSAHVWFHSQGGVNWSYYASDEMDDLLDRARSSVDQAERRELYRKSLEVFNRDFPYIFTYHPQEMKAYRNELKGYRHIPDSMMRFEDVWLAQ